MAKNKTEIHVTTVFDGELDATDVFVSLISQKYGKTNGPAVHRAAAALAELACRPLRLVHKMLVRPAQMRLQAAQSRRRACRKAKKSAKIKKSAEKRLQKPSKVLYN